MALVACFDYLGLFSGADAYFYDTFLRLRGERSVSDRIVIVTIDTNTLHSYGRWPLKRSYYARMLDKLDRAAVVGFDLLLMEPGADDPLLAAAIKKHTRVVLPEYLENPTTILKPPPGLTTCATGHIHIEPGIDSIVREVFHSIYSNGRLSSSLTSVMYELVTGTRLTRAPPPLAADSTAIRQQDLHKINYYGPPGSFRQVSLADLLSGAVSPALFEDKIVFLGVTAPGIGDAVATPFSQNRNRMAGVEVHANIMNNLLKDDSIHQVNGWLYITLLFSASMALALRLLSLDEKQACLLWLVSLFCVPTGAYLLLTGADLWLPPTVFMITFTMLFLATHLHRLDDAMRRLDREYEVMSALLGRNDGEETRQVRSGGILGLISEGGVNLKIQRQTAMISRLLSLNKKLEVALRTERDTLDQQIRFVEMLSHEYRTPLAIIRANLDILEMKDPDPEGKLSAYYAKMKRAVGRLVEVVEISLHSERLRGMPDQLELHSIELVGFMHNLLDECRELWTERHLHLEVQGDGAAYIHADYALFKTALLNLIDNAIKFSPEQEPVSLRLEATAGRATISVQQQKSGHPGRGPGVCF